MADTYSEPFLGATDAALAEFEGAVDALVVPSDEQILTVVQRVVLVLNGVNKQHEGGTYDTDEREELCLFVDAVLTEHGIDVVELATRHGVSRYEITDRWRRW
jgi:nucleotide-binding universal stress UspA family protein